MTTKEVESKALQHETDKEYNRTPLMWAARAKEPEVVKLILSKLSASERGIELSMRDSFRGWTPLHLACLDQPDLEIIQLLLDAGADLNVKDDEGVSPLILAIESASINVVELLLQRGAEICGDVGASALETAEMMGLTRISELLKTAGAKAMS